MSVVLAAVAGAAAWMSLARAAVLDDTSHRVFALPPWWWLAASVAAAVGIVAWSRLPRSRLWPLVLSAFIFLPYLPGSIPAAFLIFDGPVEGFVWAAVAAGLWFASDTRPVPALTNPRVAPWAAAVLAAAAFTFGWSQIRDLLPGGDEPHYLVITQSLLLDGDLRIQNNHERGDYRVYKDQPLKPDFIQRGKDGEIYPMHSPGVSALVLPAFAVAGYAGAVAAVIAMTAAASAVSWQAAWLLTGSAGAAWFAWAGVFLTTPFFFHGFTIYPDGAGALFTAAGLWLLVALEMRRPVTLAQLAIAGLALSILPWLHARFALVAGALGGAIVLRLLTPGSRNPVPGSRLPAPGSRLQALAFLAFPMLFAAGWFTYFYVIWGTPNPSAPQGRDLMLSVDQLRQGAVGLFFDQQFGLLAHAPVYLLAMAAFGPLAFRRPRLALELVLATLPYLLITASFAAWFGGVSAPARYLSAIAPVAVLPLAWWWWREARAVTVLLLLLSAGLLLPKLFVDGGVLAYNDRAGYDFLLDWAAPSVDLPMAFPSVFRDSPQGALNDAGMWIAGAVVVFLVGARAMRARRGAAWTATAVAAMVAIMTVCTLVWARHRVNPLRPATSQLALLRAIAPDPRAERLQVRNVSRTPHADDVLLRASMLPAGEYEWAGGSGAALQAEVGRTDLAIERAPSDAPLRLRLPVAVHSVAVRGESPAANPGLRVRHLFPPLIANAIALRAARYGHTQAYFMDDSSYVEPEGFWTRGEESTTIVFVPDREGDWTLILQSGPVATAATVSMGDWEERLEFAPHQQRPITLPPMPRASNAMPTARIVTVRTEAWFRPSERDPQSGDTRRLGLFGLVPQ